jgi:lysophospholipase L1-like esterase
MRFFLTLRIVLLAIAALGCGLGGRVVVAQSTPLFDMSPAAVAARTAVYSVPGRADLTGMGSPLKPSTKIDFFGDSITWLNGYVSNIQTAINTGAGSAGKGIVCINRGDDGGGVLQILNGDGGGHSYGGRDQQPFATTIANDHADIAVVFIGVNDVWWRGTSATTFDQGLRSIVAEGQAADVTMVLATLAVNGEKPDGTNPNDSTYDQFAQIARDVAASTGTSLVDLRTAYIDYEMNNNMPRPGRGPGGITYANSGILTYDGIHPSALGNNLLADQIAEGIYEALVPEPGVVGLLVIAGGALSGCRRRSK